MRTPGLLGLARDELLGDEIHAVAQRGHERDRGVAIERGEALGGNRAVDVADRRPQAGAEATVDASHELVDLPLQRLVLADLLTGGHGDLDQRDLAPMLLVELEQPLVGHHPLGNPLRVVESVHAEDDPFAGRTLGTPSLSGALLVFRVVDAEGEGTDVHSVVAMLDPAGLAVHPGREQTFDAFLEIRDVARGVEAHEVAGQHASQDAPIGGQDPIHVVGGEGNVQEERDPGVGAPSADEFRAEGEVVVVDPDEVSVLDLLEGRLGESLVDGLVDLPIAPIEGHALGQGVEEGPQGAVRETVIETLRVVAGEGDRTELVGTVGDLELLLGPQLGARPSRSIHHRSGASRAPWRPPVRPRSVRP